MGKPPEEGPLYKPRLQENNVRTYSKRASYENVKRINSAHEASFMFCVALAYITLRERRQKNVVL
jgi:hypothetical protein